MTIDIPLQLASYPRHWGATTARELAQFIAALPQNTTGIRFHGNVEVADAIVDALGPVLPRLRHLDLSGVPIGARGASALANDPCASALDVLILRGLMRTDILGPQSIRPDQLDPKHKAMATCRLADEGVLALAHATQLTALRKLDLSNTVASSETWLAFASSPLVRQLECLVLGAIDIEPATMVGLCKHAVALRSLVIETRHAHEDACVLASSALMPRLERLCLRWVTNETIQLVLDGPWPSLHTLEVRPTLDARTVEIIANRRGVPALRTLYLENTSQITTGREETWTDWNGAEIGSSPEYMRTADLVNEFLRSEAIEIKPGPAWPEAWLGLLGR